MAYLPRFQGARLDHVQVKSPCCCIPMEVVRFVRPRELVSFACSREVVKFGPRHVTRFPPMENVFKLGAITKIVDLFTIKKSQRKKKKRSRQQS